MDDQSLYTPQDVELIARRAAQYAVEQALNTNLENGIGLFPEGDEYMPRFMREKIIINGQPKWISGYSSQDLHESYIRLLEKEGLLERVDACDAVPMFGEYIDQFYKTFRQDQEQNTIINRERIIRNHIKPAFGKIPINKITVFDLQSFFNTLAQKYSRETILKIRNTMNPALSAAVEDGLIRRNPLDSDRIKISGKETVPHKAIPKEKMDVIKASIPMLEGRTRMMLALLCYTGMRLEEILGLKWEDIQDDWIMVQRAVVHPTRNLPVVKSPKTKTSTRIIPYVAKLKEILENNKSTGYILSKAGDGKEPLSYTEARRTFDKIRKQFDLQDFSAHDFRDTCATEWREAGIPLDVIARLLGHARTETTERKYVKYREDLLLQSVEALEAL